MGRVLRHFLLATALLGTTTGQGNSFVNGPRNLDPAVNAPGDPAPGPIMGIVAGRSKSPGDTNAGSAGSIHTHRTHSGIAFPLIL
jgi:hypothetical protein